MNLKLSGPGSERVLEEIKTQIKALDEGTLSRQNKNSEIYSINAEKGGKPDGKVLSYIETMLRIYDKSNGKFDFTLGALSDLWNFGNSPSVPDGKDIEESLEKSGSDKIRIIDGTISFPEGVVLDFGSTGKGIVLDCVRETLENTRIREAIISAGGSILLYGKRDFSVGIANPEGKSGYMGILTVNECCVSTSGSYERYFEENGKRYHHILDPDTGYPVDNGLISVTIISDSGILSDALSTACFALGLEDGMKLAKEYGCEAVFIDSDHRVYVSDGMETSLEITDSTYSINEII